MQRIAVVLFAALICGAAHAAAVGQDGARDEGTSGGYHALEFIKGMPRKGKLDIALDDAHLYALDDGTNCLYRFPADVRSAQQAKDTALLNCFTAPNEADQGSQYGGLSLDRDGRLFVLKRSSRSDSEGAVLEVDPSTGRVMRTISALQQPVSAATDPITSDLFVAQADTAKDAGQIFRFSQIRSRFRGPTKRLYARLPRAPKRIAFAPDGSLFAVVGSALFKVPYRRPGRGLSRAQKVLGSLENAIGLTVSGDGGHVVIAHAGGRITSIEAKTLRSRTILADGKTSVDCVALGPDGCYYAAVVDEIVKLSNKPDGSCSQEEDDWTPAKQKWFEKKKARMQAKRRWVEQSWKRYWADEQLEKKARQEATKAKELDVKDHKLQAQRRRMEVSIKKVEEAKEKEEVRLERRVKRVREQTAKSGKRASKRAKRLQQYQTAKAKREEKLRSEQRAKKQDLDAAALRQQVLKEQVKAGKQLQESEEKRKNIDAIEMKKKAAADAAKARARAIARQAAKEAREAKQKELKKKKLKQRRLKALYRRRVKRLRKQKRRQAAKAKRAAALQAKKKRAAAKRARAAKLAATPLPVGKWCECTVQAADWSKPFSWIGCTGGSFLTGFYRAQPNATVVQVGNATMPAIDAITAITAVQCCKPCNSLNKTLPMDECTTADRRYLKLGALACHGNAFATGLRRKDCAHAKCVDNVRCCSIDGSRGRLDTCHQMTKPPASSVVLTSSKAPANLNPFLRPGQVGWSLVEKDTFLIGLEREHRKTGLDAFNPFVCGFYGRL